MRGTTFWAHSDPSGYSHDAIGAKWQRLDDHLKATAELAAALAKAAGAPEDFSRRAFAAGLLHDLGKYTPEFQQLIRGEIKKAPHSKFGAIASYKYGSSADLAFAILGHHAGLPDKAQLTDVVKSGSAHIDPLWQTAIADFPELSACFKGHPELLGKLTIVDELHFDVHCRMLFSCLIDADRRNTAEHAEGSYPTAPAFLPFELLPKLLLAVQAKADQCEDGPVKKIRQQVLAACLNAASHPAQLFSLTVPTGGGKTFASMAFALRRAQHYPQIRRIIVVVPFLSIIEQNADAYRDALGSDIILEHHSGALGQECSEGNYNNPLSCPAAENWDAPIVITTAVRFFESLFSNRPRDLRRFHNIARSIVIFDEIQTLPRKFVSCTLSMLQQIANQWEATMVLTTATQPSLEKSHPTSPLDPRWEPGTLHEIIPDPPELFAALRRVRTDWRSVPMSCEEIADELAETPQVLIIVNTRRYAAELYKQIIRRRSAALHLSNNLCPIHKRSQLAQIKAQLKNNESCLVVSTQLVEAGVDLDFPVVWRALGPLDSIAQAAGRCDRGGRLTAKHGQPSGRLVVFEPSQATLPKGLYREACDHTRVMLAAGDAQWDDPAVIQRYFDRLYRQPDSLDPERVQDMRKAMQFATVAQTVKWIEEDSKPVLVPFDEDALKLITSIRFAGISLSRLRELQRYTVNLPNSDFIRARQIGAIYAIENTECFVLCEGLYDPQLGITPEGSDSIG